VQAGTGTAAGQAGSAAPPGLGQALRIKQFSCTVIGILAAKGQSGMGDQDDAVVVPLHTLQRRVTGNQRVNTIAVAMADGSDSAPLKASLHQLLRERRHLAANDDDNFNIFDTQQLADTLSSTMGVLTSLLGAVAAELMVVESRQAGWPSLMGALAIFSGAQLLILGIIGEYVGRAFLTVAGRPQSLVREVFTHQEVLA
jgi:ABC-type antimicrobial peptide transport system permease subunit